MLKSVIGNITQSSENVFSPCCEHQFIGVYHVIIPFLSRYYHVIVTLFLTA